MIAIFRHLALPAMLLLAAPLVCALSPVRGDDSFDERFRAMGFVDVATLDSTIVVDLMYARPDNFVGRTMYPASFTRAYLHPEAARALAAASRRLRQLHPGYRLLVCDASRPMSVQRLMYDVVRGTPQAPYVSNPANGGGLHNYGLAVDVTILDSLGCRLPMGTPVDHLGPEANIDAEQALVDRGVITPSELRNRLLLRSVMAAGGFKPLRSEWWHFNLRTRAQAKARYRRLDF